MSAKDVVRGNKTAIQTILSGDYRLILNKVYEKELITEQEYNNLKSINREDVEGHVVELVDKIMSKGDDTCRAFLNLLQTDENIKSTFPQLKDLHNDTLFLPDQASLLQHDGSSQMESLQACAGGSRSSSIEEALDSSEVAALCFLCRDVVGRHHLKGITNTKELFSRLSVLQNDHFLFQLLSTIDRVDLVRSLGIDSRRSKDTDENPVLSQYRVMLYKIYDSMNNENLIIMKFLLRSKLAKRKLDQCNTALDVFAEMEKKDLISDTNVSVLHEVLQEFDQELAMIVENYVQGVPQQQQQMLPPNRFFDTHESHLPLSVTETQPSCRGEIIYTDARPQPISLPDQSEYYTLTHKSHGLCVVFKNDIFTGTYLLKNRRGTQKDADALNTVFTLFGFKVLIHNNLTAAQMLNEIRMYSKRNFVNDDALVVCVLSYGEKGCVFGTDETRVSLKELMLPFTSGRAPTLAGKPKLFFFDGPQGDGYQKGYYPCTTTPGEDARETQFLMEGNSHMGRQFETVPSEADFLIGMATVEEFTSFRNTLTGSIYIQELCRQLTRSAESQEMDDILTVLTRVNREVSKGEFLFHKQMPEPRYTLTKKLVLKSVSPGCD